MTMAKPLEMPLPKALTSADQMDTVGTCASHIISTLTKSPAQALPPICTAENVIALCNVAARIFHDESRLLRINTNSLKVVGDVHGQLPELNTILAFGGAPSQHNKYLFLGDYVDRGKYQVECMVLLLSYKLHFPSSFFLLRGNHECPTMNVDRDGFRSKCRQKFGRNAVHKHVYEAFLRVFAHMPVAALVNGKVFCVHGGLSPSMQDFSDIQRLPHTRQVDDAVPLMRDLLWSDPRTSCTEWEVNVERGTAFCFGERQVDEFFARTGCTHIVRAHEVQSSGILTYFGKKLISIFGAANYCYSERNDACILKITQRKSDGGAKMVFIPISYRYV